MIIKKKIKAIPNAMMDGLKRMKGINLFNRFVTSIDQILDGRVGTCVQLKALCRTVLFSENGKDYLDVFYYKDESSETMIERAIAVENSRE